MNASTNYTSESLRLFTSLATYDCDHSIELESDERIEKDMEKEIRGLTGWTMGSLYMLLSFGFQFFFQISEQFFDLEIEVLSCPRQTAHVLLPRKLTLITN